MINRQLMDKVYGVLVNRVPGIRERYKRMRYHGKRRMRSIAWLYLLWLNTAYYIFRYRKLGLLEKYPYYETKKLYTDGSESSLSGRVPPEEFAQELDKYDIVSFDVFDTLVFRPFSSPADLFFLLGEELGYMDFKRIRMEMEWKAREKKYEQEKSYEITLEEIYRLLACETGIDKETVMQRELELECEYCFANPYMMRVIEELRKIGKRIIITSDMYLSAAQIRQLLEICGYGTFDQYYVSSDSGRSKSKGDLYEEVKQKESAHLGKRNLTFIHVGDNEISDIQNAKKHGFEVRHYENVNTMGEKYRPKDMSEITGSLYRGIVNTQIHNGLHIYSREYEYGFIYGGLFVTGYCQSIHHYVEKNQTERVLFLARDGDVLLKAYGLLYPEEMGKCRYAYWSRLAATKMAAGYFKYDYFRRFLYHKVNQGYSMKQIFESMEIEDMLLDFLQYMQSFCRGQNGSIAGVCHKDYLTETVTANTQLTDRNVGMVKEFLIERWEQVMIHYEEQLEAGRQYYREALNGCKKAVAVDIGWAGSGAITLDHIVNHIWHMDCEITGIIAGTNTCHNAEPDASETFLQSGKLVSYLYSQRENRDIWKFHDPGKNHNLYWEMLLDAPHGSLKGFYLDETGRWECRFKESVADKTKVEEIQKGILDFVIRYQKIMEKSGIFQKIAGRDAYAPMLAAENGKTQEFFRGICEVMDEMGI